MNLQFTVSAESFSLTPDISAYAIQCQYSQINRLEKFNDKLELTTPEGHRHVMTAGNIYILDGAAIKCTEGAETPGGASYIRLLESQLPPLNMDALNDWRQRHPMIRPLSEYATKLVSYAQAYKKEYPEASEKLCVSTAIGKLIDAYGEERQHIAHGAMQELATLWIFRT